MCVQCECLSTQLNSVHLQRSNCALLSVAFFSGYDGGTLRQHSHIDMCASYVCLQRALVQRYSAERVAVMLFPRRGSPNPLPDT